MKHLTIIAFILLLCWQPKTISQTCLPEGITFTTQAQIDGFQVNHPNCTEIEGFVQIIGPNIDNLNGLSVLSAIGGHLVINETTMNNLSGLENLTTVGGVVSIYETTLTDLIGLHNITTIGGNLRVEANESLPNLNGLSSLSSIGGSFNIYSNNLYNLIGIDKLTIIEGNLDIKDNNLNSLSGLDSLEMIGGSLILEWNGELNNLQGLGSLTSIDGNMGVRYNTSLKNFEGMSNLHTIGNRLYVEDNISLINFEGFNNVTSIGDFVIIEQYGGTALNSLSGLNNLKSVGGDFEIKHIESLHDLSGLDSLTTVEGAIEIWYCDELTSLEGLNSLINAGIYVHKCPKVNSLSGLENLEQSDVFQLSEIDSLSNLLGLNSLRLVNFLRLYGLPQIVDLSGLENLDTIHNLHIDGNESLLSLEGLSFENSTVGILSIGSNNVLNDISNLEALQYAHYSCSITNNHELQDLSALHNLDSVGSLTIANNRRLVTLEHLSNITTLHEGWFYIVGNDSLTSLSGLDNIDPTSILVLKIKDNPLLTACDINSVCDYLLIPNAFVEIHDNTVGCNSQAEVEDACTVEISEPLLNSMLSSYPNPFTTSTSIEYELTEPSNTQLTIYNAIGEVVYQAEDRIMSQGKHSFVWSADRLPEGIYYAVLRSEYGVSVVKMVKQ